MASDKTPSRSLLKILLTALLVIICLSILFTSSIPSIISTQWGKEKLLALANAQIRGKLEVSKLSVRWFGPQEIKGISLKDPDGKPVVMAAGLSSDASLFALLSNALCAGSLQIHDLDGTLIANADGVTNLEKALFEGCCPHLDTQGKQPPTIVLKKVNAYLNLMEGPQPLIVKINGDTQEGALTGNFDIDAQLSGISSKELLKDKRNIVSLLENTPNAELKIKAVVSKFPVEIIDQLVSFKNPEMVGLLTQALGPQLDLSIDQKATPEGVLLDFKAAALNMSATAETLLSSRFALQKPAQVTFKITPSLFEKLSPLAPKLAQWQLNNPVVARMQIERLEFALEDLLAGHDFDMTSIALEAAVDIDQAVIKRKGQAEAEELSVQGIHATLLTEEGVDTAAAAISGQALRNGEPIQLEFTSTLPKPASWDTFKEILLRKLTFEGTVKGLPISLLDQQLGTQGKLLAAVGRTANLELSLKQAYETPIFTIKWDSEALKSSNISFRIDKDVELIQNADIRLRMTPELLTTVINPSSVALVKPADALLHISHLSFPLSLLENPPAEFPFHQIKLDGDLHTADFIVRLSNETVNLRDFLVHFSLPASSVAKLSLTAFLMPEGQGLVANALGSKLEIKGNANIDLSTSENLDILDSFNLALTGDLLNMSLATRRDEGNHLVLSKPVSAHYILTPALLRLLNPEAASHLANENIPINLTLNASHVPLTLKELSSLLLYGDVKIETLTLQNTSERAGVNPLPIIMQDVVANWRAHNIKNLLSIDFSAVPRLGQQAAGKLQGKLSLSNWLKDNRPDFSNASIAFNSTVNKLPTETICVLLNCPEFAYLAGNAIDLTSEGDFSLLSNKGWLKFDVQSPNLKGNASLVIDNSLRLNAPAAFTFRLTPQAYAAMMKAKPDSFALSQATQATLNIKSLNIPLDATRGNTPLLLNAKIDADIFIDKLSGIDNKTGRTIVLNDLKGQISGKNLMQEVAFNFNAKGEALAGNAAPFWNITGKLENGWLPNGTLNSKDLSLSLDGKVASLPIPLLCQACGQDKLGPQFEAIIGPTLDADFKIAMRRMNGPVFVDCQGKNGHLTLDAHVVDGVLTLKKDLYAQVAITPELGKYVLQDLIPVVGGVLSSNQPLRLNVSAQGFSLHLKNLSPEAINIGSATLELGRVKFSGDSQVAKILSLLTPSNTEHVEVWLTPAYFSWYRGALKLERTDMLINDQFPIAAWGVVDVLNDRVNMIIGLSAAAIKRAFSVSDIPSKYMLQIPLKGRLKGASIDKTKAAARLSALVAQTQGGAHGLVIGTVIDIATGGLSEPKVPPPTTNPLPWVAIMEENEKARPAEEKGSKSKANSPIEEIGKGAGSLLKKIFK